MPLSFMTRNVFDVLIIIVIIVGLILAALRLRADLTRPMPPEPPEWQSFNPDEDTQPTETKH
jgi:hypothetical protein